MADASFALSEAAFKALFNRLYPTIQLPFNGSTSAGPLWLGAEGHIHVEGAGDIDFEDGNTFLLKELDLGWDSLILRLGFDLPTVTIGKFCILRFPKDTPFVGGECIVEFPGETLFEGAPDIGPVKLNLNAIMPFIVSEISGRYAISLAKDGDFLKLRADVQSLDVDPISINDTFNKLPGIIQAGVVAAAALVVSKVPQVWLLDAALGILGFPTVTSFLLDLLDIEDDVQEWLMDKLNFSIGLPNLIYQAIFDEVLKRTDLLEIKDPFEFVPEVKADVADFGGFTPPAPGGPTFKIPATEALILNPSATFEADDLKLEFDFGL
jgi:hypothetical protein